MTAHVAGSQAGPAVVLSVLLAGTAALLSGLCHIELATRLPRCGTGYTFCYVTLGELLAFVIGWSLVLENVLMGAAAAKALWQYVEYMYNSTDNSSNATASASLHGDSEIDVFNSSPDIFSCCVVIAVVFLTFITIKRCAVVYLLLVSLCALVLLAFTCVGFFHVEAENWNSPPGFFVYGIGGIVSGAALLMSTFTGIDTIACCAEETKTPSRSLPTAFSFSLALVFTGLFLVTAALTLASPWQQLEDHASLARAFETHGIFAANFVIGVGAVAGLLPVVIGSFLLPVRILYAMAEDNLLPKTFSKIGYNGIPVCPHFVTGSLIAVCSLLFDFSGVLQMSSITILLEFTASAIIVLLIRYQPSPVGISREYSDFDGSYASYEDVADCQDLLEFKEGGKSRLVLLQQEEDNASGRFSYRDSRYDSNYFTSKVRPDVCLQSQFPEQNCQQTSEFQHCPESGGYQSLFAGSGTFSPPSTLGFVNRCKRKEPNNSETQRPVYNERDSLKSAAYESNGFTQHKSYGTDMNSKKDPNRYSACCDVDIREGNNNNGKKFIRARATGLDSKTLEAESSDSFNVRKMSLTCSLKGSGTQVTLQRSSSAASSLVNLGTYEADESSWRRARYFLLVYIAASTCLAITTQLWPSQSASHAVTEDPDSGHFSAVAAVSLHAKPERPGLVTHESFRHGQHRKAFDSRIEEGGQYEVVMPPRGNNIDCVDSGSPDGPGGAWWAVLLLCSSLVVMLVSGLCIAKQPQNRTPLHFKAPYVPLVPLLALAGNMLLLAALPVVSWSRFALWTLAGLVIYFGYSQRNSRHKQHDEQDVVLFDISQLPSHGDDPTT
ncbi:cationic amino acid transporter [Elysia marginata]|uniref:Cationic amino acid transporter n=1 Tax=Elysia marginata TaxID=1093978 RepID=A0AAV4FAE6_9GAST|nr:cationic amino acid transporter [Elysia marginata]